MRRYVLLCASDSAVCRPRAGEAAQKNCLPIPEIRIQDLHATVSLGLLLITRPWRIILPVVEVITSSSNNSQVTILPIAGRMLIILSPSRRQRPRCNCNTYHHSEE